MATVPTEIAETATTVPTATALRPATAAIFSVTTALLQVLPTAQYATTVPLSTVPTVTHKTGCKVIATVPAPTTATVMRL